LPCCCRCCWQGGLPTLQALLKSFIAEVMALLLQLGQEQQQQQGGSSSSSGGPWPTPHPLEQQQAQQAALQHLQQQGLALSPLQQQVKLQQDLAELAAASAADAGDAAAVVAAAAADSKTTFPAQQQQQQQQQQVVSPFSACSPSSASARLQFLLLQVHHALIFGMLDVVWFVHSTGSIVSQCVWQPLGTAACSLLSCSSGLASAGMARPTAYHPLCCSSNPKNAE
jgi:hypothetical protein